MFPRLRGAGEYPFRLCSRDVELGVPGCFELRAQWAERFEAAERSEPFDVMEYAEHGQFAVSEVLAVALGAAAPEDMLARHYEHYTLAALDARGRLEWLATYAPDAMIVDVPPGWEPTREDEGWLAGFEQARPLLGIDLADLRPATPRGAS
jgi:hypothetical protein